MLRGRMGDMLKKINHEQRMLIQKDFLHFSHAVFKNLFIR